MNTVLAAVPLGLAIGAVLGTLGAGGSVLAVPALVYLLGQPVAAATTASLLIVSTNSAVGAAVNARRGTMAPRLAAGFASAGVVGALAGSWGARQVDEGAVLFFLAFLMLAAAALLWFRPRLERAVPHVAPAARRWAEVAATGVGVGLLTGFFGVGGGFIIVPALVLLLGLPVRIAVGTSLLVIAVVSAGGLFGHLGVGAVDWGVTLAFGAAGTVGALVGATLARRVPVRTIGRAFAVLLVAVAAFLMVLNAGAVGV